MGKGKLEVVAEKTFEKVGLNANVFGEPWAVNDMMLRYDGIFDFDAMYAAMVDWAKGYNYVWNEHVYKHKVPSPKGAEQEWLWVMDKKINDFVKYKIQIDAIAFDMREVHVEVDGRVKPLTTARIQLRIRSSVEFDWQEKFNRGAWSRLWGNLYLKFMQKEFEVIYWDNLYYKVYDFQGMLKKFFDYQGKRSWG